MSFEIASVTTCGQSLLARATATNRVRFVTSRLETTTRTAQQIGSATELPTLGNPVTGEVFSVTYSLNQTRVTCRFNNLPTTRDFHTLWLLAKLDDEADSAAVPLCAAVSQNTIYIPTTSQSESHIDIHLNLSFVRADGTVSITEGPAFTISDHEQFRVEVRDEFDEVEADIAELQDTYVTKATAQTITGDKTFNGNTTFGGAVRGYSTLNVIGATTLDATITGSLRSGTITSYAHTPRTASTSDSTGYDLGASDERWKYVYARHGNFNASITTDGTLSVTGASTLTGNTTVGGTLGVTGATTLNATTTGALTAGTITSYTHTPRTNVGYNLGSTYYRWNYVYGRYGNFSGSVSTAGSLSVSGASTLTGNTTVGGTLGVTGATTLAGLSASSLSISGTSTLTGNTTVGGTLGVTGATTLDTTTTGSLTAGAITSYTHTPRTASTSDSTGYDLGASDERWKYVYARHGNFNASITTDGTLSVTGASTLTGNTTVGGTLGVTGATTLAGLSASSLSVSGASTLTGNTTVGGTLGVTGATTLAGLSASSLSVTGSSTLSGLSASSLSVSGASTLTGNTTVGGTLGVTGATTLAGLTSGTITSYAHTPRTGSTSSATGYDLGASDKRWKYVYARYGNFSYSVTVTDGISVGGSITRPSGSTATQNIGTSDLPFANVYATSFHGSLDGNASSADEASVATEAGSCTGNAATATKLATSRTLDGMSFNGTASITHYGTCSTAAATVAKTVSLSGFNLVTGSRIAVKFTYSNTASAPTLNVNSTGAKAICYRGSSAVSNSSNYYRWQANDVVEFIYDGTNWVMVGWQTYAYNANTSDSATYATYLRYSSTNVLTAYDSSTVTSVATIRPSTSGAVSLGTSSYRWNNVYANTGNYATSITTAGTLSVTGASTLTGNTTVGGTLGVTGATTLAGLSASSLSVSSGASLSGNTTVGGTLGVTGATTLAGLSASSLSVSSGASLSGDIVINNNLYFGSAKTVKMNYYSSGIDVTGHLTPVSGSTYKLGSSSYPWERLYVNYITGTGVAKSIAGYGDATTQSATFPIGSLILAQITTATDPYGNQLSNNTRATPTYFRDMSASKLRPISLYASGGNGNVTCHQHSDQTLETSGTWRVLGDVYSANVSSWPPVVLVVRIA